MKGYLVNLKIRFPLVKALISGTIQFVNGPPMPGPITKTLISEDGLMLVYKLHLPVPGAADVVARELSVKIADADPVLFVLQPADVEFSPIKANAGEKVSGELVDVDDAGNRSEPRAFEFTAADTLAPPQPGEVTAELVAEE